MNTKALDKAGQVANIIIIVLAVIAIFINQSAAIGILVAALVRKNNLSIGDKTGSLLTILLIVVLGIALFYFADSVAVIGYVVAILAYYIIKFVLYYVFEKSANQ